MSFSLPVLVALGIYFFRPDQVKWLFANPDSFLTTSGRVTVSYIELRGSPAFNAVGWHFVIHYEYSVDGKIYESNVVNYGNTGSSNRSFAEGYVNRYPVGKPVLVYYDPQQPEKAVLEPLVKDYEMVYLIVGNILLGVFMYLLSCYIR